MATGTNIISMKEIRKLIRITNNEALYQTEDIFLEGKYEEAKAFLLSSYNKNDIESNSSLLLLLGHIFLQLNDSDSALNHFEKAEKFKDKKLGFAYDSIGIVYYLDEDYEKACYYFNEAVNCLPSNIIYHLHLAFTNEKILSLLPKDTPTTETQIYIERIKEEYSCILNLNPYHYITVMNMGVLEAKEENFDEALKFFTLANQINKNDHRTFLNIGNIYLKRQQFKQAIESYEQGLKLEANNILLLKSYMTALSKLEEWIKLEKICKSILKLEKRNTSALAWLIKAYKYNKKYSELEALLNKIKKKVNVFESGYHRKGTDQSQKDITDQLKKKLQEKIQEIKLKRQFKYEDSDDDIDIGRLQQQPKLDFDTIKALGYSEKDAQEFLNQLKADKNNVNALFNLAIIKYKEDKFEQAQKYFNQILSIKPNYKTQVIYEKLGDIYLKHHFNSKEALKYYQKAVMIEANGVLFIKIGRCYEQNGDYEIALKEYKKANEINPHFVWSVFHVGCVLSKMHQNEAIDWLKKAYDLERENVDILYHYTTALIKSDDKGYLDQGIDILEKAKEYYAGNVDILATLALGYEKKGNLTHALLLLEEANNYPEFFSDQYKLIQLAFFYEKAKNYRKAVEYFKSVLVINKNSITSLLHLGFIFKSATEFKKSYKCFRAALEIDKTNSAANFGIARVFQLMNQPNDAIHHYQISIQSNPMNAKAYLYMGLIYLENHQIDQAKDMFEHCVQLQPENAYGLAGLGNIYQEKKMMKEAEEYCYKAYSIDSTKIYTITSYGNNLFAQGKYLDSISVLEKALKIQEIAEIHFTLGHAYYLIDKYDFAISHYINALKIKKNTKPEYYFYLASALLVNTRVKDAIKCYRCAIKLNPKHSEYYYNLSNAYYINKKYQKALVYVKKCLDMEKKKPGIDKINEVKFLLFKCYFSMPTIDYEKCDKLIKDLIKEDSNNVEYFDYLASLQEKTNRTTDAILTYRVS